MIKILQKPIFLSLLSGLLLTLSWPEIGGLTPLIFIAFVPLFFLWDHLQTQMVSSFKRLGFVYLTFFIWNILTTWWVYFASDWGAAVAILLNSLFMSLTFLMAFWLRKKTSTDLGYFVLIPIWLWWEKLHLSWELSWPWLTLGNVFANQTSWIQWYEFTGYLGGSAWVLLVNILLFLCIKHNQWKGKYVIGFGSALLLPIIGSLLMFYTYTERPDQKIEVVIVQPNIDPYNEKFSGMTSMAQLYKILRLADSIITPQTNYVFAPETAIPVNIDENDYKSNREFEVLDSFLQQHPDIHLITGMNTYTIYRTEQEKTPSARRFANQEGVIWVDFYNTAAQFHQDMPATFYHKSKLVPGVEIMPYAVLFSFLNDYAINLGGISGSLGTQTKRDVLVSKHEEIRVGPIICYESVYGEYVTEYVKNGANLLVIVTNDGWWEDTPGYKQHLAYGRLRAIETRRSIVRSANTGISCVINERGDLINPTKWWQDDVLREQVNINSETTLYVRFGDYILYLSLLLLGTPFVFKKN